MRLFWLIAAVLALVLAAPAGAAVEYTVTDLGGAGQPTRDAWGVNDDGVVVGAMNTGAPSSAFRWTPEAGLRYLPGKNGIPLDVNASGVAAGLYDRPEDGFFQTAGRWNVFGDVEPLLPAADPGCNPAHGPDSEDDCDGSYAHGIGDDGVAVGASTINGGVGAELAPAYWRADGAAVRLTNTPGLLEARNASGVMVGQERPNATVWFSDSDKVTIPMLTDGQGQTGDSALARDINDAGVVVGDGATRPGGQRFRAFSWTQAGGVRRLDTLGFGTSAYAISDRGEIVGLSKVVDTAEGVRAVRWRDGVISDLNTLIAPDSGWQLLEAHDVNDQGWIVGGGLKDGQNRAFLLRPVVPLKVELEAIDSIGDLFDLRLRLTNSGNGPLTPITYRAAPTGLIDGGLAVAPVNRGAAELFAGPVPGLPGRLEPGQSLESNYRLEATRAGFLPLTAIAQTTTPEGFSVFGRSSVELEFARRDVSDQLFDAMTSGAWVEIADRVRRAYKTREEQLRKMLYKRLPRWMTGRKPSAAEVALATSMGMPADALAFAPLNGDPSVKPPKGRIEIIEASMKGSYDATRKVLQDALKAGGDGLYKIGEAEVYAFNFYKDQLWDAQTLPEQVDMGLELAHIARDSYLTLRNKGADTGSFLMQLGKGMTDRDARKTVMEDIPKWRDETIASSTESLKSGLKSATKSVARTERQFKLITDPRTDPEEAAKAAYAFNYGWTELSVKAAVDLGVQVLAEKGLGLIAGATRMVKAARAEHTLAELDDLNDLRRVPDRVATPKEVIARGHTAEDIATIQKITREESARALAVDKVDVDIGIELRDRNPVRKQGVAKVEIVTIKNINELDLHLGAVRADLGEVGLIDPKLPWYLGLMRKDVQREIRARYATRLKEIKDWDSGKMELRKALAKDGHRFDVELPGGSTKRYDMKISTEQRGRTTLIRNRELKINGRTVGKPGPIVSDTDLRGIINTKTGRALPAGIRGKYEQRIIARLANELPSFGFHGASFNAFDVPAKYAHKPLKYVLQSLPPGEARLYAKRWSKKLGVDIEDLLDEAELGQFVVKVNGREVTVGYGAAP